MIRIGHLSELKTMFTLIISFCLRVQLISSLKEEKRWIGLAGTRVENIRRCFEFDEPEKKKYVKFFSKQSNVLKEGDYLSKEIRKCQNLHVNFNDLGWN